MIKNLRQKASTKIWGLADKVGRHSNAWRAKEHKLALKLIRFLPVPSKAISFGEGLLQEIAQRVDVVCERCGTSPCPGFGEACDRWQKLQKH